MDLKRAVFYNILIDRFSRGKELDQGGWACKGPEFCGGNLRGIMERLDYIKELGADVILLTPFNKGIEYHGYHTTDLMAIDPRFGSMDDLKKLISEAHSKGMKVIMDWTINHVSIQHPFFIEAMKNKNSEYRKWFYFKKKSDKYLCFLDITTLPKLNLEHPSAKKHIFEATRYWLSLGIDGMRLDHVLGISHAFWTEFRKMIKKEFPNSILIGEAVKNRIRKGELPTLKMKNRYFAYILSSLGYNLKERLMREYSHHFDAMLDFKFRDIILEYVVKKDEPRYDLANSAIKKHYSYYLDNYPLILVLDSPDNTRLIYESEQDWELVKKCITLQMEQDKPAVIYYGSEIAISQDKPNIKAEYGDLDMRRPMPWPNINEDMLSFYKDQIARRKTKK